MSDNIAISVSHLSKCYHLYERPLERLKKALYGKGNYQEFWAVKDVSFTINKGEMVGIIGRNGSGKSTLLQIIAGTLKPTSGEVSVNGRIAALLELGSGFNPEFSGRENVFLNGAILGIPRAEMEARFDEIVAFADIGSFLDQPVKAYSSGMVVRLAFAVQACIDPDILVVDEALAVGDVFFRQKCYQRLAELRNKGCSVILVTHGMSDVEQFCQRAILLDHGDMLFQGAASEAVRRYYLIEQKTREAEFESKAARQSAATPAASSPADAGSDFWPEPDAFLDIAQESQVSNGWARCLSLALCDEQGRPSRSFRQGGVINFCYEFELLRDIEVPIAGLTIQNDRGALVHGKSTLEYGAQVPESVTAGERLRFRQQISLDLEPGDYVLSELGLAAIGRHDYELRNEYAYPELATKWIRLCYLHHVASFTVLPPQGLPLHHGVANLPGRCSVTKLAVKPDSARED